MVDRAVRPCGLTAEVLAVDLAQRALTPVRPQPGIPVPVEGTVAGRAYQLGEILPGSDGGGRCCGCRCSTAPTGPGCCGSGSGPGWSTRSRCAGAAGRCPGCSATS